MDINYRLQELERKLIRVDEYRVQGYKELNRQISEIAQTVNRQEVDNFFKKLVDTFETMLTNSYTISSNYNTILIAVGYAGFLTMWASLSNLLPTNIKLLTVIPFLISLLLVIFWEIYRMLLRSRDFTSFEKLQDEMKEKQKQNDFQAIIEIIENVNQMVNANAMKNRKYWNFVFWPAFTLGLSAALIMIGFLIFAAFTKTYPQIP